MRAVRAKCAGAELRLVFNGGGVVESGHFQTSERLTAAASTKFEGEETHECEDGAQAEASSRSAFPKPTSGPDDSMPAGSAQQSAPRFSDRTPRDARWSIPGVAVPVQKRRDHALCCASISAADSCGCCRALRPRGAGSRARSSHRRIRCSGVQVSSGITGAAARWELRLNSVNFRRRSLLEQIRRAPMRLYRSHQRCGQTIEKTLIEPKSPDISGSELPSPMVANYIRRLRYAGELLD